MNENNEKVQQNKKVNNEAVVQATPSAQPIPVRDQRNLGQYAVDKGIEAVGKTVESLEQEKPGTRRKLAGIASLAFGVGGVGAGIYLLTS